MEIDTYGKVQEEPRNHTPPPKLKFTLKTKKAFNTFQDTEAIHG